MTDKAVPRQTGTSAPHGSQARVIAIAAVLIVLVGIAGFAGWFAHGDTLFWSMLQAGLAWCL
jgi:hypothetical protein